MSREEDVEPDDVPLVAEPVELPVRSSVTAARGPLSVTTELAGPESVPFGADPEFWGLLVLSLLGPPWEVPAAI